MTTPEARHEREVALTEANEAIDRAKAVKRRSTTIAEGWIQSRDDNNFRQMLRAIGKRANNAT
jgi:hypothetical protein